MNKRELIIQVSQELGSTELGTQAVEAVLGTIRDAVIHGNKVSVPEFGIFERAERKARAARNPATGESIQLEAMSVPKFRASPHFKSAVRNGSG